MIDAHLALDPAPFRGWAEKRIADTPTPPPGSDLLAPVEKLAFDLDLSKSTLTGWRFINETLDRLAVEVALASAGLEITDIYPDLEELPEFKGQFGPPPGFGSKLSDEQVRILHRLHAERGISIRELGRRIYRQVGYASAEAAMTGIRVGFKRLCLNAVYRHPTIASELPRCADTRTDGNPCGAFAITGSDRCYPHTYPAAARESIAAASEARRQTVAA